MFVCPSDLFIFAFKNTVILFLFRSDNMETVCQLKEADSEYIRDIKTLCPYLYVTTDQHVTIYDVRKYMHNS